MFYCFTYYGDHADHYSFPTRRSSDLEGDGPRVLSQVPAAGEPVERGSAVLAYLAAPTDSTGRSLPDQIGRSREDRKSTRLNSSHMSISYAVFCLKKKKK